jgi:hypothetical protein
MNISRKQAKLMVGPGWAGLLDKLYDKKPRSVHVTQVKEKFGTLRFYVSSCLSDFADFIAEVEKESASVCEQCGKAGEVRNLSWVLTLCEDCLKERLIQLEEVRK